MAPVDVERVYAVFNLFAVSPPLAGTTAQREAYIPAYFLAIATREVGFYPTTRALHEFVKSVPTASAGEITFAAFLQFCEDVAHTSRMGRSAIYKLIDDLDGRGGGLISRRELFLILTNGSADISDGEVDAVMELLDPTLCGYVELKDLAALLIEQCQQQRSRSRTSRSRSRPESQPQPTASADPVQQQQQQQQRADRKRPEQQQQQPQNHHHHRHHRHASPSGAQPTPAEKPQERKRLHRPPSGRTASPPPQPQQQQQQKARRRRTSPARASKESAAHGDAHDEPAPRPPRKASSSSSPLQAEGGDAAAAPPAERDRSFKRTDIGSNGEVAFRKYGSVYDRADAFERTQTAMTVDVDCPMSVSRTPAREQTKDSAAQTPSPLSRRPHASTKASPASVAPLPLAPSLSADASPVPAARPAAATSIERERPSGKAGSEKEGGNDVSRPSQGEGDSEMNYYSRVEGTTRRQPAREAPQPPAEEEEQPSSMPPSPQQQQQQQERETAPVMPRNPPRVKETKTKCCAMF